LEQSLDFFSGSSAAWPFSRDSCQQSSKCTIIKPSNVSPHGTGCLFGAAEDFLEALALLATRASARP
jgi:hypothetical protein